MNIFYLHEDPVIAASYHCDQHLHKTILESAQMLSVAVRYYASWRKSFNDVYKPTHINHPCNIWLKQHINNPLWLTSLASNLNSIRMSLGSEEHASMKVIELCSTLIEVDTMHLTLPEYWKTQDPIFCGPLELRLRPDLTIQEKYQRYYIQKYRLWLDTDKPMSYKGRPLPHFLSQYKDTIPHG